MGSKLPESARLTYARQLADEAKTLVPGMERLSAIAEELRADDLYRLLGFDTWERFCTDYLGVAKSTANRWIAGQKAKSIGAGQRVAAAQNAPVVESDTLKSDKSPEGLDQWDHIGSALPTEPSGAVSANDPPTPSGPSSGGAGIQPPPRPTGDPTSPLPAPPDLPEYGGAGVDDPVDVDAIGLRWLKSKTTREVRAIGDPWGPAIRSEVRRWAEAFGAPPAPAEKPQRRQGTITRPADRAPKPPVRFNGSPFASPFERETVPRAKRHADDCSCLSCKAPKAGAK